MNDDDIARLLGQAFDAEASAAVPDSAVPPPPRFEQVAAAAEPTTELAHDLARADVEHLAAHRASVTHLGSRRRRLLAPLAAAAAVVAAVGITAAVMHDDSGSGRPAAASQATFVKPIAAEGNAQNVHIKLQQTDGQQFGIGMPVIAYFSRKITDARSLQAATRVSANGQPLDAAWYFEPSNAYPGYPYEAHLRPQSYWPAHSNIYVSVAARGMSAGKNLGFDDNVTLGFATGAATRITVDAQNHVLTVTVDGVVRFRCPVSLGRTATPTLNGIKVIMEKAPGASGSLPPATGGPHDPRLYLERLTYSGEFLQAMPDHKVPGAKSAAQDVSNGSTWVDARSALLIYKLTELGDLVDETSADGPPMKIGSGYGDWNLNWQLWLKGGAVRTH